MSLVSSLGISLMLQDQGIRDTVVMIPATAERGVMETWRSPDNSPFPSSC